VAEFDLLVLGDVNPDLVMWGGDVVPAFGQAEHLVDEAELVVGGSGGILACGAARLGLGVAVAGVVGADLFGGFMREQLAARGVDTRGVSVDPHRPTGVTVVLSGPIDRGMITMTGTIADLRAEQIDPELVRSSRHLHVSSYFLQRGLAPELPDLFDLAHEGGATTSLDPNWDPTERWDGGLMDLLQHTDVFLPNVMEATRLARTSDLTNAALRLAARARLVAVKTGAEGAVAADGDRIVRSPAVPVSVVDTTGAGDSFDAGFLAAWLDGVPLERALAVANACGALSTRAVGGTAAQPTMAEAARALEGGTAA
jgi:sugar/nucleoside kinase (ribokinase family)